jgi:HAE1 family hydrophobic/amphiphilic exporter-1
MPTCDLTEFADKQIKERLERVSGVGQVTILGGRARQIRIWLDADKMRALNVTADDVVSALRRENADMPGGNLELSGEHAEFSVKTKGEVKRVEDFKTSSSRSASSRSRRFWATSPASKTAPKTNARLPP